MLYCIAKIILLPFVCLFFLPRVSGIKNIPGKGSVIIYSKHTSILDPIILGCLLPRRIHFMAKQELFRFFPVRVILKALGAFPVKRGSADIAAVRIALRTLKEGKVFGIFPEGTRNKNSELREFNHGTAAIAHRSHAATIPVAISGGYRAFRPIRVIIGKPLDFTSYYGEKNSSELLKSMSDKLAEAVSQITPG